MPVTTISSVPLIIAILLTLMAYLKVSISGVCRDVEEAMIDATLYNDRWLLREYGVIGLIVIRAIQVFCNVRVVVQQI